MIFIFVLPVAFAIVFRNRIGINIRISNRILVLELGRVRLTLFRNKNTWSGD